MSVHIGEVTSEVVPEPEPAVEGGAEVGASTWAEQDRFRALQERLDMDRARTRAHGFDA
jgi:hypothetical protein